MTPRWRKGQVGCMVDKERQGNRSAMSAKLAPVERIRAWMHGVSGQTRRRWQLVAGCAAVVLMVVYCGGCIYFYERFWPHTTIGEATVSLMHPAEAQDSLRQSALDQTVRVVGQGVDFTLTGAGAGLAVDAEAAVETALEHTASWQWPVQIFRVHDESDVLKASFDEEQLRAVVENQLEAHNAAASDAIDAFVFYDEGTGSFEINPGSVGTKLDVDSVMVTIETALLDEEDYAPLTSAHVVQQQMTAGDERLANAVATANDYLGCNIDLMVGGVVAASVGPEEVGAWIRTGSDGSVWLDEEALGAWTSQLEATVDSVGDTKTYVRPDGKEITVSGGSYGWISDGAALNQMVRDAVYGGVTGQLDVPLKRSAAVYNPGGADWGSRYIDIDISEQWLRCYDENGSLVLEAPVITGSVATEGTATPEGSFYVNNMARDQTLIGETDPATGEPIYRTPVSYWMPFDGNLVGMHDASWQTVWDGSTYLTTSGSHGCVNLQPDVAAMVWDFARVGDPVIVHS